MVRLVYKDSCTMVQEFEQKENYQNSNMINIPAANIRSAIPNPIARAVRGLIMGLPMGQGYIKIVAPWCKPISIDKLPLRIGQKEATCQSMRCRS
jgi:hypothetical protein